MNQRITIDELDAPAPAVYHCGHSSFATILAFAGDRYTQMMAARGKRQTDGEERRRASGGGDATRLLMAVVCVGLGALFCAASVQSVLDSSRSAKSLMSSGLWNRTVESLGSRLTPFKDSQGECRLRSADRLRARGGPRRFVFRCVVVGRGWWISRRRGIPLAESAARWGTLGGDLVDSRRKLGARAARGISGRREVSGSGCPLRSGVLDRPRRGRLAGDVFAAGSTGREGLPRRRSTRATTSASRWRSGSATARTSSSLSR